MASPQEQIEPLNLDTLLLSRFIYELSIARRQFSTYPITHPFIASAADKVITILNELLSLRESVTLGIAKDTLLIGDSHLDRKNPVYRDFARLLFGYRVVSISFTRGLARQELLYFFQLVTRPPQNFQNHETLENALIAKGISGIRVRSIDYSAFKTTEADLLEGAEQALFEKRSALLWHDFARGILEGTLVDEIQQSSPLNLDPDTLADLLNRRRVQRTDGLSNSGSYEQTIHSFLQDIDAFERSQHKDALLRRLSTFISRLAPELRRQFLNSAFSSLATRHELANSVLSGIPEEAIIDALDDLNSRQASIPQMMLELIGKLSRNHSINTGLMGDGQKNVGDPALHAKLRTIFQEDSLDKFLPENYQKALHSIITSKTITPAEQFDIEQLKLSVSSHKVEEKISHIILDIINNAQTDDDAEVMQRNLVDLFGYFLSIADFPALNLIHKQMTERAAVNMKDHFNEILAAFSTADFISEVLNGVTFWGKSKFQEIGELIVQVGKPFIAPIMDQLADEQNMTLRRFYMDLLKNIGEPVKEEAISRLRDSRWYFVRNILLILGSLEDPSVTPQIRRMLKHRHVKVRQEAMKILISFKDPEAYAQLIRDLDDIDREVQLSAVRLSEYCQHPEVLKRLIPILNRGGLSGIDFDLKSAAIQSLGKIGNPASIPELERLIISRSLLRGSQLSRLKSEAVQSLKQYPAASVIDLIKTLTQSGQDELRKLAEEIYRNLSGGNRES